jgi:hypothetical protein
MHLAITIILLVVIVTGIVLLVRRSQKRRLEVTAQRAAELVEARSTRDR